MLRQRRNQVIVATSAGLVALALGATVSLRLAEFFTPGSGFNFGTQAIQPLGGNDADPGQTSQVFSLASLSPAQRAAQLEAIATGAKSIDQSRARYLLASDLIDQGRGGLALTWLEGLDQDYPVLAAQILAKRAQAYTASSQPEQAEATWKELLQRYPESPVAAEALFTLGRQTPQYWDDAIAQFPAHPRTFEIIKNRLAQNPNQPALLKVLAKHAPLASETDGALERLTTEYASQLQAEDWEAIGFAYWERQRYGSASRAYARASRTPLHLYRAARGAHLAERRTEAIAYYQQLAQAFPDADETAQGLLHLASLVGSPQAALPHLDRVIQQFPAKAAEALLAKADVLDQLRSPQSASQARQSVLSQHSRSDTAATIRWRNAQRLSKAGDLRGAWEWARQVVQENPDSDYAPEAAFWVGKWATELGQQAQAKTAFEHVLTHYPETYYAWRSASFLGWDVGDFTSVRQKLPDVAKPPIRPALPTGSDALRELYQLGRDRDAWTTWQVEFSNLRQPTVAEQFTDGVMRLGVGDNLEGIFMISSLSWREKPQDQEDYRALKQQIAYWQALYPFPFMEPIEAWSKERQLNPMLVIALIRQESRFEPEIKSVVGAAGLMQVMPETASWIGQQIGFNDYKITDPNDNIKLGTWYLDYTHREYSNNSLFAVASYNAGPGSVADWIRRFGFRDPDQFVEQIPFPETKGYVKSVFENYWNYLRLYDPTISQKLAEYSEVHAAIAASKPQR